MDTSAPRSARRALNPLKDRLDDDAFSVLSLLVTELVTNSVKHSTGPPDAAIELCIDSSRDRIRVEVTDRGDVFDPGEFADPDGDPAPSGRGLFLVDRLSSAWGIRESDPTTTVWFELDGTSGQVPRGSYPQESRSSPDSR